MSSDALKVALLAREGAARDRLREAIEAAGAQCALECDPQDIVPADVAASGAKVVLVALDPQVEDALEAFDEALADPDLEVIYEEASLAAAREGWDMARWQRHLVAKMQRHGDVLPPGTEQEAESTTPQSPAGTDGAELHLDDPELSWEADTGLAADTVETAAPDAVETINPFDPVLAEHEPEATPRFGELSLDDGSAPAAAVSVGTDERFARDIDELEERIAGLSLVDDSPEEDEPEQSRGAVLVLAGLGGPDAVRQLVAALPTEFPRPILIQQRLDGGRHDRLVAQMQRATELPVRLAEHDQYAMAGTVYILPDDLGVAVNDAGVRFQAGTELLAALPSSDSAVLLLSGTDPSVLDAALRHGWAGALVAGQTAEGCYEATASAALEARGGDTATPAEMAQRLADRWPA
ncbi:chemotaxis protein [Lysobacter ciconiae]|uniref:protein-glutamate methylesterase n=1 Tax=Novilysobacter ciconiae TaxID=2781022 RepID=A0A7S6UF33_9GAMM|nr:chemotaxis protein CheB [Lysobacter ciconiae]QOW19118.1 chemotaxis protein [Lysobacter ciconiae]